MYPITGGSAEWPLQKALYNRLIHYPELQRLVENRIFDSIVPPQYNNGTGAQFPYIVFSQFQEAPDDILTRTGNKISFVLEVWSTFQGSDEIKKVGGAIYHALHRQHRDIPVDGFNHICLEFQSSVLINNESDKVLFRGIYRYGSELSPIRQGANSGS